MPLDFTCTLPVSLTEAIDQLSAPGSRAYAGGTDLLNCLREGVFSVDRVVSLDRLDMLRGIYQTADGGLRIGAMTAISTLASNGGLRNAYTALAQAAGQVASPYLRRQGTIGGNLCQKPRCWYFRGDFFCRRKGGYRCFALTGENLYHCIFGSAGACYMVHPSDLAPALIALGACLRTASRQGVRCIALEDFFVSPQDDVQRETILSPGEIITEILLPPPALHSISSYRKVHLRSTWDFTLAGVALVLQFDGDWIRTANVLLSGAAPVPWRSKGAEDTLIGAKLTGRTAAAAAAAAVDHCQPLSQNAYKIDLFKELIKDQLLAIRQRFSQPAVPRQAHFKIPHHC
jgi:xanthine dehydrogenase YagS FAD-binding subunit